MFLHCHLFYLLQKMIWHTTIVLFLFPTSAVPLTFSWHMYSSTIRSLELIDHIFRCIDTFKFVRTICGRHNHMVIRMNEICHRLTRRCMLVLDKNSVTGGFELSTCPYLQHVPDVDNYAVWDWNCIHIITCEMISMLNDSINLLTNILTYLTHVQNQYPFFSFSSAYSFSIGRK